MLLGLHVDGTAGFPAAQGSSRTSVTPNAGKQRDTKCEHMRSCAECPKQLKPVAAGGTHGKSQSRGPRRHCTAQPSSVCSFLVGRCNDTIKVQVLSTSGPKPHCPEPQLLPQSFGPLIPTP